MPTVGLNPWVIQHIILQTASDSHWRRSPFNQDSEILAKLINQGFVPDWTLANNTFLYRRNEEFGYLTSLDCAVVGPVEQLTSWRASEDSEGLTLENAGDPYVGLLQKRTGELIRPILRRNTLSYGILISMDCLAVGGGLMIAAAHPLAGLAAGLAIYLGANWLIDPSLSHDAILELNHQALALYNHLEDKGQIYHDQEALELLGIYS